MPLLSDKCCLVVVGRYIHESNISTDMEIMHYARISSAVMLESGAKPLWEAGMSVYEGSSCISTKYKESVLTGSVMMLVERCKK